MVNSLLCYYSRLYPFHYEIDTIYQNYLFGVEITSPLIASVVKSTIYLIFDILLAFN